MFQQADSDMLKSGRDNMCGRPTDGSVGVCAEEQGIFLIEKMPRRCSDRLEEAVLSGRMPGKCVFKTGLRPEAVC